MKFTQVLWKQHLGRFIRKKWYEETKTRVVDLRHDQELKNMNVPIFDANAVITPPKYFTEFNFEKLKENYEMFEEIIPKHDEECFTYTDSSLFILGLRQAERIFKTIKIADNLPDKVEASIQDVPENIHEIVQKNIFH